jgi:hypothetical protein
MKKIIGFFFLFILILAFIKLININQNIIAEKKVTQNCSQLKYYQSLDLNNKSFKSFNAELIIDDWRKWQVTNIKDFVNYEKFNQFTNRKRSKGKLFISGKNIPNCFFKIKLRAHGDQKDHREGDYLPSMQVKIDNGNIFGITDFLLLRPKQRGQYNEILVTALFRKIGLLAPRTSMVNITFNSGNYKFVFQEKIRKEFLENSGLKEGPIFEGDERFVFDQGDVPFVNHRVSNKSFSKKNYVNEHITEKGLSILNFYGSNHSNKVFRNSLVDYFDLSSQMGRDDFLDLDIFDSLMFATDSLAGLSIQDRRFYFNSINNKFYPIFYDGIPKILTKHNTLLKKKIIYEEFTEVKKPYIKYVLPSMFEGKVSPSAIHGAKHSIKLLDKINIEIFNRELANLGLNITDKRLSEILDLLINRLESISAFKENKVYDFKKKNLSFFSRTYFNNRFNNDRIIFYSQDEKYYYMCKVYYKDCKLVDKINFNKTKLMAQEEKYNSKRIIFTGKKYNKKIDKGWYFKNNSYEFKQKVIQGKKIHYTDGINLNFNQNEKILNINKELPYARVLLKNLSIDGWTINFIDKTKIQNENLKKSIFTDLNGLTGCLTFFNTKLKKINIQIENAMCEDSINLINSEGEIDNVKIYDAASDAIDLDFSNFRIKNIFIIGAGNDCADFSYGNYEIENLIVSECGDKGLSVGESSKVNVLNYESNKTNLSIASKDGSILNLKTVNINDTKYCYSAYKKKQEFYGASLKIENGQCNNYVKKIELDKISILSYNNTSQTSQ